MSFVFCPSRIVLPPIPNLSPSDLWTGTGGDPAVIAFATGAAAIGARVITTGDVCYRFSVSGWSDFLPVYAICNGYVFWQSLSGYWLYLITGNRWVIHGKFPGYVPTATTDETGKYVGDGWYQSASFSLPFGDGATASFAPMGTMINSTGTSKTVSFSFPRWSRSSFLGVYTAAGGQTGLTSRTIGLPRWRDNKGIYYIRSSEKTGGRWTYGDIHYAASSGQWVIGNPGDAAGWFVGGEPITTGSIVFVHTLPEGSEAEPLANLTISFVDYVLGDEKTKLLMGEAAIWRA